MKEMWDAFQEACAFISNNLTLTVLFITTIATIVEKGPTAAKPISKFLLWLNSLSNKEILDKMNDMQKDFVKLNDKMILLDEKIDNNERDRIKNEILSFANKLREGKKYNKDAFQHIQGIYHKYHEELNGNGLITEEYEYIMSIYNTTKF